MRPFNPNSLYHHAWYHNKPGDTNHAFPAEGGFTSICDKTFSSLHVLQEQVKGVYRSLSTSGKPGKGRYRYCKQCLKLLPKAEVKIHLTVIKQLLEEAKADRDSAIQRVDRLHEEYLKTIELKNQLK